MKKLLIACTLFYAVLTVPAFASAQRQQPHAVGNMYTKALNTIEACGMLDHLDSTKHVAVSDIHIDHGQVFVTLDENDGAITVVYDPIANKLLRQTPSGTQ